MADFHAWPGVAARKNSDIVVLTSLQRFYDNGPDRTLSTVMTPPTFKTRDEYIKTLPCLGNHEGLPLEQYSPKKHLDSVGLFDESLITAEDWDLWLRLTRHFPFVNIFKPLRLYLKCAGSLTSRTRVDKTLQGQLRIIAKVAKSHMLAPSEISLARIRIYLEFAAIYKYKSITITSMPMLLRALMISPSECTISLTKKFSKLFAFYR